MNAAFIKGFSKGLLLSVSILAATYSVSFVYGYGNERGKMADREGYYANIKF